MFNHYFAEQEMANRQRELRCALEQSRQLAGLRRQGAGHRSAAGLARVLRNVADHLDSSTAA